MTVSDNYVKWRSRTFLAVIVFLFFAFFSLQSAGQTRVTYEEGIVELKNKQTVVGYIKNDDWTNMLYRINFKHAQTDETSINYDTAQIRRFWIGTKDVFELLNFPVYNAAAPVSAFAKMIVRGDASLYKTVYKGELLYIIKRDNTLYVLQNDNLAARTAKAPTADYQYRDRLIQAVGKSVASNANAGKLAYSEKNFIDLVTAYNSSVSSPNDILLSATKPVHFLLATVGGGYQQTDGGEFFLHTAHRTYFPELSRNTSLNIGFNFYASKYSEIERISSTEYEFNYTSLLFAIPVEVQHNFLNKAIRPFVSAGFSFCFNSIRDQFGGSTRRVLQNSVGIRPVYSGGVEADLAKNFLVKAAYRKEVYSHLVLLGIGYNFSK